MKGNVSRLRSGAVSFVEVMVGICLTACLLTLLGQWLWQSKSQLPRFQEAYTHQACKKWVRAFKQSILQLSGPHNRGTSFVFHPSGKDFGLRLCSENETLDDGPSGTAVRVQCDRSYCGQTVRMDCLQRSHSQSKAYAMIGRIP